MLHKFRQVPSVTASTSEILFVEQESEAVSVDGPTVSASSNKSATFLY